jgi:hypothetical protein
MTGLSGRAAEPRGLFSGIASDALVGRHCEMREALDELDGAKVRSEV